MSDGRDDDGVGSEITVLKGSHVYGGGKGASTRYSFDFALSEKVAPRRAYDLCAKRIVDSCLNQHFNGTIFAYGKFCVVGLYSVKT